MKILALLFTVFICSQAEAQVADSMQVKKDSVPALELMPEFPGGTIALYKFMFDNIQYPKEAFENEIEGTVYVKFKVDENGFAVSPQVMRGIGGGCDEEAIRLVNLLPQWTPGLINGQPAAVYFTMPVKFTLSSVTKEEKKKLKKE